MTTNKNGFWFSGEMTFLGICMLVQIFTIKDITYI